VADFRAEEMQGRRRFFGGDRVMMSWLVVRRFFVATVEGKFAGLGRLQG
jgi:hypothetical protein